MYTVTVEAGFCATHRLRLADGTVEPQHEHDWAARAHFVRPDLDDSGMVVGFLEAQRALQSVVGRLHHSSLNDCEAFAGLNPTAEIVARHVYEQLRMLGLTTIRRVEVTEIPGCVATYEPTEPGDGGAVTESADPRST